MTPLMYASREGRLTVVESLLAVTSDVDYQDNKGYTVCCVQWFTLLDLQNTAS